MEFYTSKSEEIKIELKKLNRKTKDPITKIKLNEVISMIKPLEKNMNERFLEIPIYLYLNLIKPMIGHR